MSFNRSDLVVSERQQKLVSLQFRRRLRVSVQNQKQTVRRHTSSLRLLGDVRPGVEGDAPREAEPGQEVVARRQQQPAGRSEGEGETEVEGVHREEDEQQIERPSSSAAETQTDAI